MSNQKFSNKTLLYPFNQDLLPDIDKIHDIGTPTRRFKHVHTDNLTTSFFSTSSSIVDSIIFDIANQDVRLSRTSANLLTLDNGVGGDAKIISSEYQIGDADYKLVQEGAGNICANYFDTLSHFKYNRTNKTLKLTIAGGDSIEFEEFLGHTHIIVSGEVHVDTIEEKTSGVGVTIDSVLLKDGVVDPPLGYNLNSKLWSRVGAEGILLGNYDGTSVLSFGNLISGYQAAKFILAGCSRNVIFGTRALGNATGNSVVNMVIIGFESCLNANNMDNGVIVGSQSGKNLTSGGNNNVIVGFATGNTATSANKITLIGSSSDVLSSGLINCSTLGTSAIVQTSHSTQIGDRVDNSTGVLSFHIQDVIDESMNDGFSGLIINGTGGSNSKEGLYITQTMSDTFGNGTDTSSTAVIRVKRVGDSVSLVMQLWTVNPTVAAQFDFGTAIDANYRPPYDLTFSVFVQEATGGDSFKRLIIDSASGIITVSELGGNNLNTGVGINTVNGTGVSWSL